MIGGDPEQFDFYKRSIYVMRNPMTAFPAHTNAKGTFLQAFVGSCFEEGRIKLKEPF
jgi:hypothetical protein